MKHFFLLASTPDCLTTVSWISTEWKSSSLNIALCGVIFNVRIGNNFGLKNSVFYIRNVLLVSWLLCPFRRLWKGCLDSPTYRRPQTKHIYTYILTLWVYNMKQGNHENHRPIAGYWQVLSYNVVRLALIKIQSHNISDDRHWLHIIYTYILTLWVYNMKQGNHGNEQFHFISAKYKQNIDNIIYIQENPHHWTLLSVEWFSTWESGTILD
jgi:hypothetical protein